MPKIHRALISVYDKTGIAEFAKFLQQQNVEIISTGGTAKHLNENGVATLSISEVTGFPEILGGRVKTLNPMIFGGLLALRENSAQMEQIQEHGIKPIDMVVVNLYPFEATVAKEGVTLPDALENIDIGGPSLIRASAKNYLDVTVVTSPNQYEQIINELGNNDGETTLELRKTLAMEAFGTTARYDSAIHNYLSQASPEDAQLPDRMQFKLEKVQSLRYGENPHQKAALYKESGVTSGLVNARQLHGKELSFNNFIDLDAAMGIAQEFSEPCAVIIKHTNPCGVAVGENLHETFLNAKATDPVSAFGGIIGLNRSVDKETAQAISEMFVEAIIAPEFDPAALEILEAKKNLRLIETPGINRKRTAEFDVKTVYGGLLLQDRDIFDIDKINFEVATQRQPTDDEWAALKFSWRVCKWVKSNAIVYAKKDRTIGVGAGQMSRVDSSNIAVEKAKRMGLEIAGTVMASDAFFPFRDGVDIAANAGATAVIQPGGSIRDEEVVQAANEHKMAMVFTKVRHFRH